MSTTTTFRPGEPIWVDLGTPDLAATAAFYGPLLGWEAEPPQERYGGYASWLLGGRKVAGLMPLMSPEQPPVWTCYICTEDADTSAARVTEAGGAVIARPMDVDDLGRMAVFAEPAGPVFGVWQPGSHRGAEVVDEPGAMTWTELTTRDLASSTRFYERVFGWVARPTADYTELLLDGRAVAGCMPMPEAVPDDVPPAWMPYFAVADPTAAAAQVRELGGTLLVEPTDYGTGSFVVVQDPHGATFGLIAHRGG